MMPLSLPQLTPEKLKRLYITEQKSVLQIAKILDSNPKSISRYLKRFGIKARPFSTKGLQTRLGAVLSEETKEKIRQKHIGRKASRETRKKISAWMKKNTPWRGRKHSEVSKALQSMKMRGRKLTPEHRAKVLKTLAKAWKNPLRGEDSPAWKGGISPINARIRTSSRMKKWRQRVLARDGFKCVLCGSRERLHVDHIKPFATHKSLRNRTVNGRTLCEPCHRQTPTYGGRVRQIVTPQTVRAKERV